MDEAELRAIAHKIHNEGQRLIEKAAYTNSWGDNGGFNMQHEARLFLAGLDRRLPGGWEKYAERARLEADPEYTLYLSLKNKFGE